MRQEQRQERERGGGGLVGYFARVTHWSHWQALRGSGRFTPPGSDLIRERMEEEAQACGEAVEFRPGDIMARFYEFTPADFFADFGRFAEAVAEEIAEYIEDDPDDPRDRADHVATVTELAEDLGDARTVAAYLDGGGAVDILDALQVEADRLGVWLRIFETYNANDDDDPRRGPVSRIVADMHDLIRF